jgi:hypothetical protein
MKIALPYELRRAIETTNEGPLVDNLNCPPWYRKKSIAQRMDHYEHLHAQLMDLARTIS